MPFEVVQYPETDGISGTELTAHWSKDHDGEGTVSLVITRHVWGQIEVEPDELPPPPPYGRDHGHHNDCTACADRVAVVEELRASGKLPEHHMVEVSGSSVVGEFDAPASVVTKPMTRSEINKLIRVLRRARDQAYGEDA